MLPGLNRRSGADQQGNRQTNVAQSQLNIGLAAAEKLDQRARSILSQELGHERLEIVSVCIGYTDPGSGPPLCAPGRQSPSPLADPA